MYGRHALEEALLNAPQVVRKVFLSSELAGDREVTAMLKKAKGAYSVMEKKEAGRMVGQETAHQGVIAVVDTSSLLVDFGSFLRGLEPTERTMLVILDELTAPHNVGAIIRSAAAFGASGVLMPGHHQARITGAVVKASAGMVFRLPLVAIGNVNYAISDLQKAGSQAYALAMEGSKNIVKEKFEAPSVFVVGNEGRGIRQGTAKICDAVLRIPMDPRCESLNASVSAA